MLQLPMMGTIHNMVKTQQLTLKWQQRKEDPKKEKGTPEEQQIARFKEDAERIRKSNAISTIDGKLKSGQNLSNDELEYLRINSPELYKKAMEVAMEREQYRKELEGCKTKEDVERVNTNKMQRFLSETKTIRSNPNIPMGKKLELLDQVTRRLMAVKSEHLTFTRTPEYAELPREAEVEEGKAKKKEKSVVEIEDGSEAEKPHLDQKPEQIERPTEQTGQTGQTGQSEAADPNAPSEPSAEPPKAVVATTTPKPSAGAKYAVGARTDAYVANKTSSVSPSPSPAQTTRTAKKPVSISIRA